MSKTKQKWQEYECVWGNSRASGNDLLLLLVLVKFRQDGGMWATKEKLALLMRCNVDTVDRCLKRLKALGELDWDKGSNHSKKANFYRIYLPGLDGNTPLISPRNSSEIPPETHGKYPRNITPLNIKEIERKEMLSVFDKSEDGSLMVWLSKNYSIPDRLLAEQLSLFADSWICRREQSEESRLAQWWIWFDKFAASQAGRGN